MKKCLFSLIDVENGMYDLSLHTVLTSPCFAFFWGLIQKANRLKPRFKNPFNMTIAQAQAAGGGNSRQSIWDKQQRLNKVKIDGQNLIVITAGSKKDNLAAKYKINYKLLIPEKPVIIESTDIPSNIIDELLTNSGRSADDLLTFLRSDQKRGDKKSSSSDTSNVSTKQGPPQPGDDDERFKWLLGLMQNAAPGWAPANDTQRELAADLLEYTNGEIETVFNRAASEGVRRNKLLRWVQRGLDNFDKWYTGGNNGYEGVTGSKLDTWERELRTLETEIQAIDDAGLMDDSRNAPFLEQTLPKIEMLKEMITENGGKV